MGVDGAPLEAHELPSGCQVQLTVLTIPRRLAVGERGRDQNLTPDGPILTWGEGSRCREEWWPERAADRPPPPAV